MVDTPSEDMVDTPASEFWKTFNKDWPNLEVVEPHDFYPFFEAIGSFD
jgi:hypothetical protein